MDTTGFFFQNNSTNHNHTPTSPDGLVYKHLQLTLKTQIELNKQTDQFIEDSSYIPPFDEFYSDLPTTTDVPYYELMNEPYTIMHYHPTSTLPISTNSGNLMNNNNSLLHKPFHTYFDEPPSYILHNNENQHHFHTGSTPILSTSFSLSSLSSEDEDNKRKRKSNKKTSLARKKSSLSSTMSDLALLVADNHLSDDDEEEEEDEYYESYRKTNNNEKAAASESKKGRNVDKACNHCKRSHLRCDNARPCRRCVTTGKEGCQDVSHKPRGRPRLQQKKMLSSLF